MSQGLTQTEIQYLMVFLKDTPSIGLDEFENKFISSASFEPAGLGQSRLYKEFFSEETKIKVLVTGEIELNEKNVFVGLKMAFPEWEFELFPMSIQKLILKDTNRLSAEDAGVVATIEPTIKSDKVEWLEPCVFDLSQEASRAKFSSYLQESIANEPETSTSDVPQLEKQLEQFKDIWSRDYYKNESSPFSEESSGSSDSPENNIEASLDELFSDIKGFSKEAPDSSHDEVFSNAPDLTNEIPDRSLEDPFDDFPSYEPEPPDTYLTADTKRDLLPVDNISGVDSDELLNEFDERKSLWPFTDPIEDGKSESDNFTEEFNNKATFDKLDLDEEILQEKPLMTEDELRAHPGSNGSTHEIQILGMVGENATDDLRKLVDTDGEHKDQESFLDKIGGRSQDLISNLQNKIKVLPLQKIGTILLVTGIISVALSFGVKFIEPDFDSAKNAAGIIDINEWIISNDMLGEETSEVFEAWKGTAEFQQFWAWHDNTWLTRISIFTGVKGILNKVGILFALSGLLVFGISFLAKRIPTDFSDDDSQISYAGDKRISLSFTTYNDAWPIVDTWSKECGFKILETEGSRRLYRKAGNPSYPPTLCMLACLDDQVEIEAWMTTRIPTKLIAIFSDLGIDVLEAKNTVIPIEVKDQINILLIRLGHPPLA